MPDLLFIPTPDDAVSDARIGDWSMRLSPITVEAGTTPPVHGDLIDAIGDLSSSGNDAVQAVTADKPIVDLNTQPGLGLAKVTGTQHLTAAQSAAVVAIMITFRSPSASATKGLLARDTSETTTKAAIDLALV